MIKINSEKVIVYKRCLMDESDIYKCKYCDFTYRVQAFLDDEDEYGEHSWRVWNQSGKKLHCPYCGINQSKEEKLND